MRICGVIAEYNPFHEGHAHHIAEARRLAGADALIVVMSGHFVQRGEPAVFNPYVRTEAALRAGADAVFMMPPEASTSSAEGFAGYGIGLLDKLGCDCFSCGIEQGQSAGRIAELAHVLADESGELSGRIKELMRTGITYPEALARAAGTGNPGPNTMLAVEYVKALIRSGSGMEFVPVIRQGSGYNDTELNSDTEFPSATALRRAMLAGASVLRDYPERYGLTGRSDCMPLGPDDFLPEFINSIIRSSEMKECLEEYLDVDFAIASRLIKTEFRYKTYEEMVRDIKTREYTFTRIARGIVHIFLGIKERKSGISAAQLIGFRNPAVLSELKERSQVTLISKPADFREELESSARAARLYNQTYWNKYHIELPNFFRQNIVRI